MFKFKTYTICTADNQARLAFAPEKGGTAYSLMIHHQGKERELLYLHDFFQKEEWHDLAGGWPFLFPICARLERQGKAGCYLYDGKLYQLPIHGFSWQLPWEVENVKEDQLTLVLTDNKKTQRMYPFRFLIKLTYSISNDHLVCEQHYQNTGDIALPYYAGFHPYFLTPEADKGKDQVKINYYPKRCLQYNAELTDIVGEARLFTLPSAITNPAINEQLTQVDANNRVELIYPDGLTLALQVLGKEDKHMFSYVQLYTMPEKPFFCMEPWMSFPNAMNTVAGVRWLQPKQSEQATLILRWR